MSSESPAPAHAPAHAPGSGRAEVVFIDVDDTLVRTVGTKRIPIPGAIAGVHALFEKGNVLYLWSSGGADYARASARELGVEACFVGFLPKPTLVVDDQPLAEWRALRHRYPANILDERSPPVSGQARTKTRPAPSLLHHVSIAVRSLERSAPFYDALLAPLGFVRVWEHPEGDRAGVGYGRPGEDDQFAIKRRHDAPVAARGAHIAFGARDEAAVQAAFEAALAHGGSDEGAPGLRPQYGEGYFAAFVADPDGQHVEIVVAVPS